MPPSSTKPGARTQGPFAGFGGDQIWPTLATRKAAGLRIVVASGDALTMRFSSVPVSVTGNALRLRRSRVGVCGFGSIASNGCPHPCADLSNWGSL
jgi:hypothetical protein